MEKYIDLHSHTNASDGTFSPAELLKLAKKKKLSALAVTDHDTLLGIPAAEEEAKKQGIELVKGVEITCDDPDTGVIDIHVLGLLINEHSTKLQKLLTESQKHRIGQKKAIVEKLQEFGIKITYAEVVKESNGGVTGRPHIARVALRNNPDKFKDIEDVFRKYLRQGEKAYIPRQEETKPQDAIAAIHDAGGLAIIAHPFVYRYAVPEIMIKQFKACGGDGVEVYYPHYIKSDFKEADNPALIAQLQALAKKYKLLESGGNDFHGNSKHADMAKLKIPYSILEKLKEALQ